jgi:cytochrome c oxidase subunit 2
MRKSMLVLIGMIGAAGMLLLGHAPAPAAGAHETHVSARKYEFDPSTITVKRGEQVKLTITAVDHDHGFKLEGFGVDKLLKKGQATTIQFTADKAGTFPFQCSHFCGMGHGKMKGQLVVEE